MPYFNEKEYYIDIDRVIELCQTNNAEITDIENDNDSTEDTEEVVLEIGDDGDDDAYESTIEINVFKYEMFKMCVERVLSEFVEVEEDAELFGDIPMSPSYNIAFNTLRVYEIIKENE
jgi:hypothetical protein